MVRSAVVLAVFSIIFVSQATAQFESEPILQGYVTRAVSASDFDVNGIHIQSNQETSFGITTRPDRSLIEGRRTDPWLGEVVTVFGKMDKRHHRVIATGIVFYLRDTLQVSGFAVIDRILSPLKSDEILVRADGYPIRINTKTKIKFTAPLTSLSGVTPNVWLAYSGSLPRDGIVIADSVTLSPNQIEYGEDKLLQKTAYDPSTVPDSAGQDELKKLAFGADPKQVPPYHDAALQARVERIGNSLIPEYQRALPKSDGTKIPFQFQLIDHPKLRYAWAMPSGVILIPRQIVELIPNDSQLAAVLADGVSCALEKQALREEQSDNGKAFSTIAGLAGGPMLFGASAYLNYGRNVYGTNSPAQHRHQEQRDRVALSLMHDAGYDLNEAPKAWWLLSAKDANHVADTTMPERAVYLYQIMGEVWRNEANHSAPTTSSNSK